MKCRARSGAARARPPRISPPATGAPALSCATILPALLTVTTIPPGCHFGPSFDALADTSLRGWGDAAARWSVIGTARGSGPTGVALCGSPGRKEKPVAELGPPARFKLACRSSVAQRRGTGLPGGLQAVSVSVQRARSSSASSRAGRLGRAASTGVTCGVANRRTRFT